MRTARFFLSLPPRALMANAAALIAFLFAPAIHAGHPSSIDGDTRQAILDCTFEVLAHIRDGEKAAPLVRVAGTAFCFGDGELATAAHVFDQVLGSRFDVPVVRDRAGHTYPVERILRYSTRDDFAVFTVSGLAPAAARPHAALDSVSAKSATPLYLAWRKADGEIAFERTRYRGSSTLETLGREGWIAFGPAPDQGASGAALLDSAGRVVGLVNIRSSGRAGALAYAVPVQIIEASSLKEAEISVRDPLRVLGMASERNLPLQGGIPLPAPYERFNRHMSEVRRTYFAYTLPYSLSLSGAGAPMSDAGRADLCAALGPRYCGEQQFETRHRERARGCLVKWSGVGAALVECAEDSEAVPTAVGSVPPPCRADDPLEDLPSMETFTDPAGATWQMREWSVRGCDWTVLSMFRPSGAGGTVALIRGAPSAYAEAAAMQLKALTGIRTASKPPSSVLAEAH